MQNWFPNRQACKLETQTMTIGETDSHWRVCAEGRLSCYTTNLWILTGLVIVSVDFFFSQQVQWVSTPRPSAGRLKGKQSQSNKREEVSAGFSVRLVSEAAWSFKHNAVTDFWSFSCSVKQQPDADYCLLLVIQFLEFVRSERISYYLTSNTITWDRTLFIPRGIVVQQLQNKVGKSANVNINKQISKRYTMPKI